MKEMKKVVLRLEDVSGDPERHFEMARSAAMLAAGKGALLIAWRDQIIGRYSPCVDCREKCELDSWEKYGYDRGADLRIDVDNGRYSFIFKTH